MIFATHLIFSLLCSLITIKILNIENQILFVIIVCFFGIIPDIDENKSKIGKKIPLISFLINFFFKHRGFFHSLFVPFGIYALFLFLNLEIIGLAILIGYLSHLLLDMLNPSGIAFFYPISKKKIKGFIKTNSILEKIIFVIILILDIYLIIKK